jgi:hypothetical protein
MEYIFHQSHMGMFSRCQVAYYRRYICGEIIPPAIALIMGTGLHGGAELNFKQKMETRKDLPVSDVKAAAAAVFEERLSVDGVYMTMEEKTRADQLLGESKDKMIEMTGVFQREASPRIQPLAVEKEISFKRESLPDVVFNGQLDLVEESGQNVIDIKTSKNKWQEGKADSELQPTFYLQGAREIGMNPQQFIYHVVTKAKMPVHQMIVTNRDESDLVALEARARVMMECIKAGIFSPCDPGHWMCTVAWCGYFPTCKYRSERDKNRYFSIPEVKSA